MKRLSTLLVTLSLLVFTSLILVSCEKWVTPNKVERILKKDKWEITSFKFQGGDITSTYTGVMLGFGDEGSMSFINSGGVTGKWSVSSGKNPTILYISGILVEPYSNFSDNWEVQTCTKDKITMQIEHGSYVNSVSLIRIKD